MTAGVVDERMAHRFQDTSELVKASFDVQRVDVDETIKRPDHIDRCGREGYAAPIRQQEFKVRASVISLATELQRLFGDIDEYSLRTLR